MEQQSANSPTDPQRPDASHLDSLWIESGKSAHLKAIFQNIQDAEAFVLEGPPQKKYSRAVCYELARLIACRVYGKACLEFVCAVTVAQIMSPPRDGYVGFFMPEGPANKRTFKHKLDRAGQSGRGAGVLALTSSGVSLSPIGLDFQVHFDRLPLMTAFFDFLIEAIGFAPLDEILSDAITAPHAPVIEQAARALSKAVYAFLSDHLPSQQTQSKFRQVSAFFQQDATAAAAGGWDIPKPDDARILAFWQQAAFEPGSDFKTYRTAVAAVLAYWRAMEQAMAERAMQHADTMGGDWEQGEYDVSAEHVLDQQLTHEDAVLSPLTSLDEAPLDQIKALNKSERQMLDPMMAWFPITPHLPLTHLRWQVFGGVQAKISQALRRGSEQHQTARDMLAQVTPEQNYPDVVRDWGTLISHCHKVAQAAAVILLAHGRIAGLNILMAADPQATFESITRQITAAAAALAHADLDNVVAFPGQDGGRGRGPAQAEPAQDTLSGLQHILPTLVLATGKQPADQRPELSNADATCLNQAQRAFKEINRQGFKSMTDVDEDTLDGLEQMVPVVEMVKKQLTSLHTSQQHPEVLAATYDVDRQHFMAIFANLYGENA